MPLRVDVEQACSPLLWVDADHAPLSRLRRMARAPSDPEEYESRRGLASQDERDGSPHCGTATTDAHVARVGGIQKSPAFTPTWRRTVYVAYSVEECFTSPMRVQEPVVGHRQDRSNSSAHDPERWSQRCTVIRALVSFPHLRTSNTARYLKVLGLYVRRAPEKQWSGMRAGGGGSLLAAVTGPQTNAAAATQIQARATKRGSRTRRVPGGRDRMVPGLR